MNNFAEPPQKSKPLSIKERGMVELKRLDLERKLTWKPNEKIEMVQKAQFLGRQNGGSIKQNVRQLFEEKLKADKAKKIMKGTPRVRSSVDSRISRGHRFPREKQG